MKLFAGAPGIMTCWAPGIMICTWPPFGRATLKFCATGDVGTTITTALFGFAPGGSSMESATRQPSVNAVSVGAEGPMRVKWSSDGTSDRSWCANISNFKS